jgi:hypothetical protein
MSAKDVADKMLSARNVQQIGGLGRAVNDTQSLLTVIRNAISSPAVAGAAKQTSTWGEAAALLLGVNVRTAYAQPSSSNRAAGDANVKLQPDKAKVVAEACSKLIVVKALVYPRYGASRLELGGSYNVHDYAPTRPLDRKIARGEPVTPEDLTPPAPLYMRYLGRIKIS